MNTSDWRRFLHSLVCCCFSSAIRLRVRTASVQTLGTLPPPDGQLSLVRLHQRHGPLSPEALSLCAVPPPNHTGLLPHLRRYKPRGLTGGMLDNISYLQISSNINDLISQAACTTGVSGPMGRRGATRQTRVRCVYVVMGQFSASGSAVLLPAAPTRFRVSAACPVMVSVEHLVTPRGSHLGNSSPHSRSGRTSASCRVIHT